MPLGIHNVPKIHLCACINASNSCRNASISLTQTNKWMIIETMPTTIDECDDISHFLMNWGLIGETASPLDICTKVITYVICYTKIISNRITTSQNHFPNKCLLNVPCKTLNAFFRNIAISKTLWIKMYISIKKKLQSNEQFVFLFLLFPKFSWYYFIYYSKLNCNFNQIVF